MEHNEIKEAIFEAFKAVNEREELKAFIMGELFKAVNDDRWITIHPHGEDSDDYRRLKVKDGETVEEAMHRQGYYNKRKAKDEKALKEEKKKVYQDILKAKKDGNKELHHKLLKRYNEIEAQLKGQKTPEEKPQEPERETQKETEYTEFKDTSEKIEYFKQLDVSKLSYKQLEKAEENIEVLLLESLDISDRKALQKTLFSITDRKERQGAIEKAKEKGGYTEKLQDLTNFSHFSDISSYPLELQKHIYNNYKKVYDKYPQLSKQGYGSLKKENIKSSTYANNLSIVNSVTLNSSWYDDLSKLKKSYEDDVESEWHPPGTDYNSIITHELGHGLLGYIQSHLGVSGKAIRAKVLKKLGLKIKDIDKHLSRYPNNSKNPPHEFFAEAFAEYMDSPNPRPLAVEFGKEIERILRDLG